jgi:hypothetical protein
MFETTVTETKPEMAKVINLEVGINTAEIDRKYRMYCLVLRQLSPIQKGVQSAHSIVEYAIKYGDEESYIIWSRADKTIIMLDGGTLPELYKIIDELDENNVKYAVFREEDLGEIVTSISILVDERVFDRKNYPDFGIWRNRKYPVRPMYTMYCTGEFDHDPNDYTYNEHHEEWLNDVIGGKQNEFLRELIGNKRLSQ